MNPVVIDLMDLVERHGAQSAVVRKTIRNPDAPPGVAHIIDTTVTLFGCSKIDPTHHLYDRQRSFPVAQGAIVDNSRYIAHEVAKRLER